MNSKALVSIITPFLNAEKFFQEAIDSVLAQTYDNWELLLIDDGSTDGSTAMARHYAKQFPDKVRYLEHEEHRNLGKSTSRNLGIRNAKGEYLIFLDADDILLPEKLERQVAILKSQPGAAMVYGRTQYWYSWTGNPKDRRRDYISKLGVQANLSFEPPALLTHFLRDSGTVPCLCAFVARHAVVEEVGGFEETIQHLYEDQVFLAKMCLVAPVVVESGCWERYRQHQESSSSIAIQAGEYNPFSPNPARLSFLTWLTEYIANQSLTDDELHKALQKELRPYRYPNLYRLINLIYYPVMQINSYVGLIVRRVLPIMHSFFI